MKQTLRLMRSSAWRHANRHVLPTRYDIIHAAAWLTLGCCLLYILYAASALAQAEDILGQNERILACLNDQGSLGTVKEKDGSVWSVRCDLKMVRHG